MRTLLPVLLVAAALAAEDEKPDDGRRLKADHAPTPYTADQIRDACREGRTSTYRIEGEGHDTVRQTFRFSKCDEKGCDVEVSAVKEDGEAAGEPRTRRQTWKELQAHASYVEKETKIAEEQVTVPQGKHDCTLYTVTRDGSVMRAWFSKKLPGPPVKMTVERDGKTIYAMTLVEHRDGKAPLDR